MSDPVSDPVSEQPDTPQSATPQSATIGKYSDYVSFESEFGMDDAPGVASNASQAALSKADLTKAVEQLQASLSQDTVNTGVYYSKSFLETLKQQTPWAVWKTVTRAKEDRVQKRLFADEKPVENWVYHIKYRVRLSVVADPELDPERFPAKLLDSWSHWSRWIEGPSIYRRKNGAEARIKNVTSRGNFGNPELYEFCVEPECLSSSYRERTKNRWRVRGIQQKARREAAESARQRALDEAVEKEKKQTRKQRFLDAADTALTKVNCVSNPVSNRPVWVHPLPKPLVTAGPSPPVTFFKYQIVPVTPEKIYTVESGINSADPPPKTD